MPSRRLSSAIEQQRHSSFQCASPDNPVARITFSVFPFRLDSTG
jgi:hypothetical protein